MILPWMTEAATNYVRDESRHVKFTNRWTPRDAKVGNLVRKPSNWAHKKDAGKRVTERKRGIEMVSVGGRYTLASSQTDASDDSWWDIIACKLDLRLGTISQNEDKKTWTIDFIDASLEAALLQNIWKVTQDDPKIETFVFSAAPAAARVGDFTVHGTPVGPGLGSPNVLIGGMPALRSGVDMHVCGLCTPNPHLGGPAISSQASVFVNGFPLLRAGDAFIEAGGGPNPIAMGCPSVQVGSPAPPVDVLAFSAPEPGFIDLELDVLTSVGWGKVADKVGAEIGGERVLKNHYAKVDIRLAALRVNPKGKITLRIPGASRPHDIPFDIGFNFITLGREYDSSGNRIAAGNGWFSADATIEPGKLGELFEGVF